MTQNATYPQNAAINPASTSGAQLASYVDALRDNMYSGHLGTAQPVYSQAGLLWTQTAVGQIILHIATSTTTSADIGWVDTATNDFIISPQESIAHVNVNTSTAYSLSSTAGSVEMESTIYEVTGSPAAALSVIFPNNTKVRRLQFDNLTAQLLTVKSVSQVGGVDIPAGKTMALYYNGTKIEPATSAYLTSANPVVSGTISGTDLNFSNVTIGTSTTVAGPIMGSAIGTYGTMSILGAKGTITGLDYRTGTLITNTSLGYTGFNASSTYAFLNAAGTEMASISSAGAFKAIGDITAFGTVTAYSDRTLKENIFTIPDALAKVNALRGVSFNRIGKEKTEIGVVAQEVREVLPEVVHQDSETELLHVAYGNLVGLLIEAVKELSTKVDKLEVECHKA